MYYVLGCGFKHLSLFGEMIQFDEHIFQMGWFNHQLRSKFFMHPIGLASWDLNQWFRVNELVFV